VNFGEGLEVVNGGLGFERRVNGDVVVVSRKREGSLFFFLYELGQRSTQIGLRSTQLPGMKICYLRPTQYHLRPMQLPGPNFFYLRPTQCKAPKLQLWLFSSQISFYWLT
jgi:hypothetical protein